jgi:hypothetical protein
MEEFVGYPLDIAISQGIEIGSGKACFSVGIEKQVYCIIVWESSRLVGK